MRMMQYQYPSTGIGRLGVKIVLLLVCAMAGTTLAGAEPTAAPPAIADKAEQRKLFERAQEALRRGQTREFRQLLGQLENYPLHPYLEYAYIQRRLHLLPQAQVDDFLARQGGSYLAEKLERQWVDTLAKQRQWEAVIRYHNPRNTTTELQCHALRARLNTGDESAYAEVAPLWNVSKSQPKACDPVFAAWMDAGHLTGEIAWQRFGKTLKARQHSLARYIMKKMPAAERALADLYYQVDRNPRLLQQQSRFSRQSARMQEIILHGLERLSLRDAALALALWHNYDAQQLFDDDARLHTQRYIAVRLLRQGYTRETEELLAAAPALSSESLTEWLVRDALRKQDWPRVEKWLARLPADSRHSERWRYWQARLLAQQPGDEARAEAEAIYRSLSKTRSFYGFLAADILGIEYHLADKPIAVEQALLEEVAGMPAVERARELYIMGDNLNARREWYHLTAGMDDQQVIAAGKLAERWGWHRNGIQAMIQARYWDDLQLRFPLAYHEQVTSAARDNAITPHLLFAIARQESAFTPDARSPAGALGLMQLLPSTAKQTASRAGLRINTYDLLQPDTNITLGSRYITQLLNEFKGNRILAAAAYNAGPSRVKQWLSKDTRDSLPFDIWIETIPYRETRGYVQNVLAYSVIYGYRLGDVKPFITEGEASALF